MRNMKNIVVLVGALLAVGFIVATVVAARYEDLLNETIESGTAGHELTAAQAAVGAARAAQMRAENAAEEAAFKKREADDWKAVMAESQAEAPAWVIKLAAAEMKAAATAAEEAAFDAMLADQWSEKAQDRLARAKAEAQRLGID